MHARLAHGTPRVEGTSTRAENSTRLKIDVANILFLFLTCVTRLEMRCLQGRGIKNPSNKCYSSIRWLGYGAIIISSSNCVPKYMLLPQG